MRKRRSGDMRNEARSHQNEELAAEQGSRRHLRSFENLAVGPDGCNCIQHLSKEAKKQNRIEFSHLRKLNLEDGSASAQEVVDIEVGVCEYDMIIQRQGKRRRQLIFDDAK